MLLERMSLHKILLIRKRLLICLVQRELNLENNILNCLKLQIKEIYFLNFYFVFFHNFKIIKKMKKEKSKLFLYFMEILVLKLSKLLDN